MIRPQPFTERPHFGEPPVGAVMAFAGDLGAPVPVQEGVPEGKGPAYVTEPIEAWGWMLCDGRALDTYDYHELFCALGYLYGGEGDSFNIPDYRGAFMRGTDLGADKDPDRNKRTSASGGNELYDGVGSRQLYAVQNHEHDLAVAPMPSGDKAKVDIVTKSPTKVQTAEVYLDPAADPPIEVSKNETRPANTAVNYIIKFTYRVRRHAGRRS